MLKKIRVLPPLPGSTQCRLNRERLAVHGGEGQIVWYCEDKQAQVFLTDSSPFSPGDSIQIGRPIRVPPKEQSRAYAYYVQCTPGSRVKMEKPRESFAPDAANAGVYQRLIQEVFRGVRDFTHPVLQRTWPIFH